MPPPVQIGLIYLVIAVGVEHVVDNFLVKYWGGASGNRGYQPDPVSRATVSQFQFVFEMFHERFRGNMVIHDRNSVRLQRKTIEIKHKNNNRLGNICCEYTVIFVALKPMLLRNKPISCPVTE